MILDLMQIFPDQFKGIGKLPGKYKIELRDDVIISVQLLARNVPDVLRQSLEQKLDFMEKKDVIAKVEKATGCCHGLIYVVKSDKSLRICWDPRNLNHLIKSPKYVCAPNKDILQTLSKGR